MLQAHIALHFGHILRLGPICRFGIGIHHPKDPLCPRKSRKDRGHLLGDHIYRHGKLSGIVGKDREFTGSEARKKHQNSAGANRHSVGHLRGIAHNRPHNAAVELGFELFVPQIVVQLAEFLHAGFLMVKDLDDLLSGDAFFDITVHRTDRLLLPLVVLGASLGNRPAAEGNERDEEKNDQSQPDVGGNHEDKGA